VPRLVDGFPSVWPLADGDVFFLLAAALQHNRLVDRSANPVAARGRLGGLRLGCLRRGGLGCARLLYRGLSSLRAVLMARPLASLLAAAAAVLLSRVVFVVAGVGSEPTTFGS